MFLFVIVFVVVGGGYGGVGDGDCGDAHWIRRLLDDCQYNGF